MGSLRACTGIGTLPCECEPTTLRTVDFFLKKTYRGVLYMRAFAAFCLVSTAAFLGCTGTARDRRFLPSISRWDSARGALFCAGSEQICSRFAQRQPALQRDTGYCTACRPAEVNNLLCRKNASKIMLIFSSNKIMLIWQKKVCTSVSTSQEGETT